MFRNLLLLCSLVFFLGSCQKNSITGRNQLILVSETELQQMATQQYQSFLGENKVVASAGNKDAEMVKRVGKPDCRIDNGLL